MCGIAGIISRNKEAINESVLMQMADSLAHRGPDGFGTWINSVNTIGMSHRRLAIIDTSEAAAQPMHYLNRYSIVYNGELYNYIELKNELKKSGYHFYTMSDTEVILAAYDAYKEKCLSFFDGMFSFAIWDEVLHTLFAARDRFGEKPFYYTTKKHYFAFGSEMKALWAAGIEKNHDLRMMLNFLALGQVTDPSILSKTFYKNIHTLPPAHYLTYDFHDDTFHVQSYWNIDKQAGILIDIKDSMNLLNQQISESVNRRLRSDVPIGCSLSGGLDSSTLVRYIREQPGFSNNRLPVFSAVFPGFERDESAHIETMCSTYNLTSYKLSPNANQLIASFERMAFHQEEPIPSASIFAQYAVYEHAKKNGITVLIDGQGADEILAGYPKYFQWYLQELLTRNKFSELYREYKALHKNHPNFKWGIPHLAAAILPAHTAIALEKKAFNRINSLEDISKEFSSITRGSAWEGIHKPVVTKLNDILYFNTMQQGLSDLLRFSDRNAMSHGVEVRLPFLEPSMVKFIFSLPANLKIHNGYSKYILRLLSDKKLPDSIVWRKDKTGFEPPQLEWMKQTAMQDYMMDAKQTLVNARLLKPQALQRPITAKHAHDAGNMDWRYLSLAGFLK